MLLEFFGYVGSVLVVVSMLMSSVVKLRVINMVGSVISGTYALIIGSFPLALMNISLIIINGINLYKLLMNKQTYDLIETGAGDGFLTYFLDHYQADIRSFFPGFDGRVEGRNVAYIISCGGDPAGVLLGDIDDAGVLEIALDYTTPKYRDCSVGRYLMEMLPKLGASKLVLPQPDQQHIPYLEKLGYQKQGDSYIREF